MASTDISPQGWVTRLAAALDVPVGDSVERFCDRFAAELRHFMELGVLVHPTSLAVVTLGSGPRFADRLASFLREAGHDPARCDAIHDLRATIDDWMLVRLLANGAGTPEVGLYFRKHMDVAATIAWLAERGVSAAELDGLRTLSGLVGSRRTGIFAASFKADRPVYYKPYLHAFADDSRSMAACFAPVFKYFRVTDPRWPAFLDALDRMGSERPADVYVSLQLGDGDAFDSLKLDLFRVDVRAFAETLRRCGLLEPGDVSPAAVGGRLDLATAEHCGLRFSATGCGMTFYFVPPRDLDD